MAEKLPVGFGTGLGWQAPDIVAAVKGLLARGVSFERYEQMQQDELGIWSKPTGATVAWFRDLYGDALRVSEHRLREVGAGVGSRACLLQLC